MQASKRKPVYIRRVAADLQIKSIDRKETMEFLKKVFGDKALTFEEFRTALDGDESIRLVNLADGQYVDRGKLTDKINELKAANGTIEKLKADGADVEKLRQTIADYEQAENDRKQKEAEEAELKNLKGRLSDLKGKNEFLNEGTENWIFNEFKNAVSLVENKGKSDEDIYAAITKDKNIYKSPNSKLVISPVGYTSSGKSFKSKADIMAIKDSTERIKAIQENPNFFKKE